MRIAVFSDIHGNIAALDAMLSDARAQQVEHFWCLGDLVAYGPRPVEVVEVLRSLPDLLCVRGNTDRYVLTGVLSGMIPAIDDPRTPAGFAALAATRESLAWTRGCLVGGGQLDWVGKRPLEERWVLPGGMKVLLVHASPGRDDGWGMHQSVDDNALVAAGFGSADADLILVGHTHVPGERALAGVRILNPGPVSLPRSPTTHASWALLDATTNGCRISWRSVSYDVGEVVQDLDRQRHPAKDWIAAKLLGDKSPRTQ